MNLNPFSWFRKQPESAESENNLVLIGMYVTLIHGDNHNDDSRFKMFAPIPRGGEVEHKFHGDEVYDKNGNLVNSYDYRAGYTVVREFVYSEGDAQ